MIVQSDGDARSVLAAKPTLDETASRDLVACIFPGKKYFASGRGDLSYANPPKGKVFAASFPGVKIAACIEFGKDFPSKLPAQFIAPKGRTYLHAMHSVVDWFAFALWQDGVLQRALSLSPDSGILENIGDHLAFEQPFWDSKQPALDPEEDSSSYPFPFHPLELGEAALMDFFGYQLEGTIVPCLIAPESISLMHFTEAKPWWHIW